MANGRSMYVWIRIYAELVRMFLIRLLSLSFFSLSLSRSHSLAFAFEIERKRINESRHSFFLYFHWLFNKLKDQLLYY